MKKIFTLIITILTLSACSLNPNPKIYKPQTLIDSIGNEIQFNEIPQNVASLSISIADVWNIAGGNITAITEDVIKYPFLDEIQEYTKIGMCEYPNLPKILEIKPDFILLSKDIQAHMDIIQELENNNIKYGVFSLKNFDEYQSLLKQFCILLENENNYSLYALDLQREMDFIRHNIDLAIKPKILLLSANQNEIKAHDNTHHTADILKSIGTINISENSYQILELFDKEEILEQNPDFILYVSTDLDDKAAIDLIHQEIVQDEYIQQTNAIKNGKIIQLERDLYHIKPGKRWASAYANLANIIYDKNLIQLN